MEQTGSSMFGCFPVVLIGLLFGAFAFLGVSQTAVVPATAPVEAQAQSAPTEVTAGVQSLTVIEKIETGVSASSPATVTMQVSGYQPDGCLIPVQVEQTRAGNKVTVKIFRMMPTDVMCSMQLNPYNETITLDGTFESGNYTIDVNGTIVELKV